jgi:REP element-mobilizing transposase RayT
MNVGSPKGWYSRGRLPHYDGGKIAQFITFRLFDSLPKAILKQFEAELAVRDVENMARETLILIDRYLDRGVGSCFLKRFEIAELVKGTLLHHAGTKYDLVSWVIMPNHVHLLVRPLEGHELYEIIHSIKSYTAKEANKMLGRTGNFWMREYFDRYIRDFEHFAKTVRYIEQNPVKAGLCESAEEWRFSSAFQKRD